MWFDDTAPYNDLDAIAADTGPTHATVRLPILSLDRHDEPFWHSVIPFVASVFAQELTHLVHWDISMAAMQGFAKARDAARLSSGTPPNTWLAVYYGTWPEMEGHAAQIAYEVLAACQWKSPQSLPAEIDKTHTWSRIAKRLDFANSKRFAAFSNFRGNLEAEVHNHILVWI